MPLDAAEAGISLSEEYLRTTLSACARFQSWVRGLSAAEAAKRVYPCGLPLPPINNDGTIPDAYTAEQLCQLRPFALLWADERAGWRTNRVGSEAWDEAGQLLIAFEQNVPPDLERGLAELDRQFKNDLGVIAEQMTALAYQGGYLAIDQIIVRGPWRCHPDDVADQGSHVYAEMQVTWGLGGGQ